MKVLASCGCLFFCMICATMEVHAKVCCIPFNGNLSKSYSVSLLTMTEPRPKLPVQIYQVTIGYSAWMVPFLLPMI